MTYQIFFMGTLFFSMLLPPQLCASGYQYPDDLKPAEKLVIKIRKEAAKKITKKYDLKQIGEGSSMPRCVVHSIHLHFMIADRPFTKDFARELLINCAHDFLEVINSYPELAEYAPIFPFKIDNIKITFASYQVDPNITFAVIRNHKLIYRIYNKNWEEISEESEPYETALEIVQRK